MESNFFGKNSSPANLYRSLEDLKRLETYLKLLTTFNVYADLIIRRKYSQKLNEDLFELYDGYLHDLP
jgi:hypothetical protein